MLSSRFRTLRRHLGDALNALVAPGRTAGFAWLGIVAAVAARSARLETLMDRFEAGTLQARKAFTRSAKPASRKVAVPVARQPPAWPEHRPFWLWLVGYNHQLAEVRSTWTVGRSMGAYGPPGVRHAMEFAGRLQAMVATDAVMRGLLAISRAARREVRWYWRMSSREAMPEILREVPRPRPARPAAGERHPRRPRDRRGPARPARPPGPFESPPDNLSREERVLRGMPVPDPIVIDERDRVGFWSAEQQGRRNRYTPGRG